MPRWFVYVNTNSTEKHITIHPEANGPCGTICQQICVGGPYEDTFPIERPNESIIKTGETLNSYWLIVWAQNLNDVINHPYIQAEANRTEVIPKICDTCQ